MFKYEIYPSPEGTCFPLHSLTPTHRNLKANSSRLENIRQLESVSASLKTKSFSKSIPLSLSFLFSGERWRRTTFVDAKPGPSDLLEPNEENFNLLGLG